MRSKIVVVVIPINVDLSSEPLIIHILGYEVAVLPIVLVVAERGCALGPPYLSPSYPSCPSLRSAHALIGCSV